MVLSAGVVYVAEIYSLLEVPAHGSSNNPLEAGIEILPDKPKRYPSTID